MTIQTAPPFGIPDWPGIKGFLSSAVGFTATAATLDAASEAFCWVGPAPATGTLSNILFRMGTTSATSGPYSFDVRVETVTSAGRPSGTLWATNTNGAHSLTGTDDSTWANVALTASASITKGEPIAIVIKAPASGTFSMAIDGRQTIASPGGVYPFAASDTSGAPDGTYETGITTAAPCLGAVISSVNYQFECCSVISTVSTSTYNNTSSPDEKATRIYLPGPVRVVGMRALMLNIVAGADFTFTLWPDSAGTQTDANALAQRAMDGDLAYTATNDGWVTTYFSSPVELQANTVYWAGVRADTANNIILITGTTESSPDLMPCLPCGSSGYLGTRAWSAGSASAFSTSTTSFAVIQLICDGIDDGAGGSGGIKTHPGMSGGMRG